MWAMCDGRSTSMFGVWTMAWTVVFVGYVVRMGRISPSPCCTYRRC
jgi:hypothetical protein